MAGIAGREEDVIEHLQLVFIELPKFPVHSPDQKKLRLLWLRFLREIDEKTVHISQDLLDVPEISEAIVLAEEAAYTASELNIYETYWDNVRTEKTLWVGRYEEGLAEGLAKGLAEGLAKGKLDEKRQIAKKMMQRGFTIEIIMEDTGLTREQIDDMSVGFD